MAQESSFVIRESGPEAIVRARALRIGIVKINDAYAREEFSRGGIKIAVILRDKLLVGKG
jgi:hypothetical protein